MLRSLLLFLTLVMLFLLTSCGGDEVEVIPNDTLDCSTITATYSGNIKSIMDGNCATSGCHNSGTQANGIDLSTYDLVKSESSSNRFLGSIKHEGGFSQMPRGKSKLPNATIDMIACWIENGTPE